MKNINYVVSQIEKITGLPRCRIDLLQVGNTINVCYGGNKLLNKTMERSRITLRIVTHDYPSDYWY
jgi:hypothetical protein